MLSAQSSRGPLSVGAWPSAHDHTVSLGGFFTPLGLLANEQAICSPSHGQKSLQDKTDTVAIFDCTGYAVP